MAYPTYMSMTLIDRESGTISETIFILARFSAVSMMNS